MILGTAGHIDHGKTALVRALTGTDTDRLAEEKRRGITIELGFARLDLEGVGTVGVVDVPGHEAFVRTMLAGASGMDAALLVVACDAGVMPQTREHVAILHLLGVPRAVVALTKADLVDDEWGALVAEEVRVLLAGTTLEGAPIVRVSSVTGQGIDELRLALTQALGVARTRDSDAPFRLPVDRAFTVKGTGTVVTGTVWSGTLERDSAVRLLPDAHVARVRGIESHGAPQEHVAAGARAALALAGVEVAQAARGHVVVADSAWAPSTRLRADVTLLEATGPIGPRARLQLHLGTTDVTARVIAAGGPIVPGAPRATRIVTDRPVVARGGDRFVLRGGPRLTTLGGGIVTDPQPPLRRARPFAHPGAALKARLGWMLAEAGPAGVAMGVLALRLGTAVGATDVLVHDAKAVVRHDRAWSRELVSGFGATLERAVRSHVARHPADDGAPTARLLAEITRESLFAAVVLAHGVEALGLTEVGPVLRPRGWAPLNDPVALADRRWVIERLRAAGSEPPNAAELAAERGHEVRTALKGLEKEGAIVPVELDRWYAAESFASILRLLAAALQAPAPVAPSALREALGVSRKFLIPLLEHCDRRGFTRRQGDGRVRGPALPQYDDLS